MTTTLAQAADAILDYSVHRAGGAPGIVAMATSRDDCLYAGAAGVRESGRDAPMTTDTVMLLASCTKAITGVALMQLVEEGQVRLTDPAREYVPAIADIQVLEGFAPDGEPRLRTPARDITLEHLVLHTAGFGYDFFSAELLRYRELRGIPSILSCLPESIHDVLLHDPGARWTYGNNIDWLGLVIEALRGKRLGEVFVERIFAPLGMRDTAFTMNDDMAARRATIHLRAPDGQLTAAPDMCLPQPPAMDMGGHGLYASLGDYLAFIRMFLNDGVGPHGRVLEAATVARMAQDGLGGLSSGGWVTSNPQLANSGEFFPGLAKTWAYTFQRNEEPAPTGRPAGQLAWAGLANTYYWIDRQTGVGGIWSGQVLPFHDVAAYPGYVDFETAVYRTLG
ncbi:MAG: serine hydrolase domain-containing protein [Gammaproteobacteria bacterium]